MEISDRGKVNMWPFKKKQKMTMEELRKIIKEVTIHAVLFESEWGKDILRFEMGDENIDIHLNNPEHQAEIQRAYAAVMFRNLGNDVWVQLSYADDYTNEQYIEYCERFVCFINQELDRIAKEVYKGILK